MNFTRSIRKSNEFRVMNSPDNLIHVRIGDWKLVPGLVLVAAGANYDVREREREAGMSIARARVCQTYTYLYINTDSNYVQFTRGRRKIHPLTQ